MLKSICMESEHLPHRLFSFYVSTLNTPFAMRREAHLAGSGLLSDNLDMFVMFGV